MRDSYVTADLSATDALVANAGSPSAVDAPLIPGRSCPLHYRYRPDSFARPAELAADTIYVVGGLYGNRPALQALLALFDAEAGHALLGDGKGWAVPGATANLAAAGRPHATKALVFNGDFHWFDTDPQAFAQITQNVLAHHAIRGNVETELGATDDADDAGCGCAYPEWVGEQVVARSNRIMASLRRTARGHPLLLQQLQALPMTLRIDVGGARVGIVHGDAESLAGWGFAQEALLQPEGVAQAQQWLQRGALDVFASTHTCLPVLQQLGAGWLINNGAAGMPNLRGDAAGLLTRISTQPARIGRRVFGTTLQVALGTGTDTAQGHTQTPAQTPTQTQTIYIDALAIDIDAAVWQTEFLAQWPPGSDAHASYWQRISAGPDYPLHSVLRTS